MCNYDTNVTQLYEFLESSNWEKARSRCRSHSHEARTWIVRRDTISQKVRWKLLPLHAAVIFQSPNFVVSAIIDQYPAAVSRRDDQGMLPLHLAFRYKEDSEDLLELLLNQYPKGALTKDKRDRLPLEHGRGSKFSAKLMRLYAEANVSGSKTQTLIGTSADHHNHLRHIDVNNSENMNEIIAEYENKTRTLTSMYEGRIKMVQDQNKSSMNQLRLSTDEEKRKLINCHVEEIETMREMLNTHAGNEGAVISDLEGEVTNLRLAVSHAKEDRDAAELHAADMKSYAEQLAIQMRHILHEQEALQLMVSQQQQELDKAHSQREQSIQNLLRQEQEERPQRVRGGSDIKQMIESSRSSIKSMLAREPARTERSATVGNDAGTKPSHTPHGNGRHHTGHDGQTPGHSPPLRYTPVRAHNTTPRGVAGTGGVTPVSNKNNRLVLPSGSTVDNINKGVVGGGSHGHHRNNYFAGSPAIKDDISAITDCSNF